MIAVRPPEYWPRLSFLALALQAGRLVLADTFQYSRQSYQNRARLRTPQGRQWISVPLRGGQHGRPVADVEIEPREPFLRKHWRALEFNYRSTPFFEFYEPEVQPLFERSWTSLADLTCATVECLCGLYGLALPLERASALPGAPATLAAVVAATGAEALVAPAENAPHDADAGVPVAVLDYREPRRHQNFPGFEPDLSALDLLFNYGPEAPALLREGLQPLAG